MLPARSGLPFSSACLALFAFNPLSVQEFKKMALL